MRSLLRFAAPAALVFVLAMMIFASITADNVSVEAATGPTVGCTALPYKSFAINVASGDGMTSQLTQTQQNVGITKSVDGIRYYCPQTTPAPSPTPTKTLTVTATPSGAVSPSATPTTKSTVAPTPTRDIPPTVTLTPSQTPSPTVVSTNTPMVTSTSQVTPTQTPATPTPTQTPATPTPTKTSIPTVTPTVVVQCGDKDNTYTTSPPPAGFTSISMGTFPYNPCIGQQVRIVFKATTTKPIASVDICVWSDAGNPCLGPSTYPTGTTLVTVEKYWVANSYKTQFAVEAAIVFEDGTFADLIYPLPTQGVPSSNSSLSLPYILGLAFMGVGGASAIGLLKPTEKE